MKLLHDGDYDRLVLNGDIIELWLGDFDKIKRHPVARKIEEISEIKDVIWLFGNHDYNARKFRDFWPRVYKLDSFETNENGYRTLIMHGHQVYAFKNMSWFSKLMSRFNIWIERAFSVDFQRAGQKTCCYKKKVKRKRKKIIKRYGNGVDKIVIGHTHLVGCEKVGDCELLDIGSIVFTRTYATIDNGLVTLRRL
jgi:predicted phosphodiesterase